MSIFPESRQFTWIVKRPKRGAVSLASMSDALLFRSDRKLSQPRLEVGEVEVT
jgi:hypothetical protein